ncbi:testis-expressed protein 12-like isoform X2 [Pungitius pungitius]|uniref:testis-expressed protein 12-like isoform X2 n=1 Tax=Pungitius pungitius TaxID=134920 RepID=UPI002E0FA343
MNKKRYVTIKEAVHMAEKMIPPISNKRPLNNNKGSKQTEKETEQTPANQDKSPPKKKKPPSSSSTLESAGLFEATTAGASKDITMLLSTFSEVLSERAAGDASQMKELQGILTEAQKLESYLREKKKRLRQTLALISDKLQG